MKKILLTIAIIFGLGFSFTSCNSDGDFEFGENETVIYDDVDLNYVPVEIYKLDSINHRIDSLEDVISKLYLEEAPLFEHHKYECLFLYNRLVTIDNDGTRWSNYTEHGDTLIGPKNWVNEGYAEPDTIIWCDCGCYEIQEEIGHNDDEINECNKSKNDLIDIARRDPVLQDVYDYVGNITVEWYLEHKRNFYKNIV